MYQLNLHLTDYSTRGFQTLAVHKIESTFKPSGRKEKYIPNDTRSEEEEHLWVWST
jgi:hypothetical protein